jgi:hypothetical protein
LARKFETHHEKGVLGFTLIFYLKGAEWLISLKALTIIIQKKLRNMAQHLPE